MWRAPGIRRAKAQSTNSRRSLCLEGDTQGTQWSHGRVSRCGEAVITGYYWGAENTSSFLRMLLLVRPLPVINPAHTESPELHYSFYRYTCYFHVPTIMKAPPPSPPLWSVSIWLCNTRAGSVCWTSFFFLFPPCALEHGSNQTMNLQEAERVRAKASPHGAALKTWVWSGGGGATSV